MSFHVNLERKQRKWIVLPMPCGHLLKWKGTVADWPHIAHPAWCVCSNKHTTINSLSFNSIPNKFLKEKP